MGRAGAEGAFYNVVINLNNMKASDFVTTTRKKADQYLAKSTQLAEDITATVRRALGS